MKVFMVIGYHVIFGTYGFWLPNDPRGSWSEMVRSWELFRFGGAATKTNSRHSVATAPHNLSKRLDMKRHLKRPPVVFNGVQARAVGNGFTIAVAKGDYTVYACAILPEHVHLVVGRCAVSIEQIVGKLKQRATIQLVAEGFPKSQTPWAVGCWKVFLNLPEDMNRAIAYVENNPQKEGKPKQHWSFVQKYE